MSARHEEQGRPDLRMPLLGAAAWAGGLAGFLLPVGAVAAFLGAGALGVAVGGLRGRGVLVPAACLLVGSGVAGAAMLRSEAVHDSPVAAIASTGGFARITARVTADPVRRVGRHSSYVLVRLTVREVEHGGRRETTHVPVLVVANTSWLRVRLGEQLTAGGRLRPSDGRDLAAVLSTARPPVVERAPPQLFGAAEALRQAIRAAVGWAGPDERALVPALVTGDDQRLRDQVVEDFRTCGLTHLAAVSGTNLTLVVGFLLLLARGLGVRASGLLVVGALGVAGFVLLARAEPSVVRAAAMGSVALLGMGGNGRERGTRGLGAAVLVLLLFDPWLATSIGFALSALATAGILFLAPAFRDALARWLPKWAAEAVAVPFAAQLACTPVVAAISGQVSLVAVAANLVVAPVIGPATVLGLVGGLCYLLLPAAGLVCGWLAGWCGWWVLTVAARGAALPEAAVDWSAGTGGIVLLTVLCVGVVLLAPRVLARRGWSVSLCLTLTILMLRPLPVLGWPPAGWVLVACDVGQGDGLVLNAGDGRGVVVDTGPDPAAMGRCLRRLRVRSVPVVVLTHFHADHVDGLPAVLAEHRVGEIDVTATRVPEYGAEQVDRWAAARAVPVRVPPWGEVRRVGDLVWQVVGPVAAVTERGDAEEGSVANDASLVLVVASRGIRLLLSGDMEPQAQAEVHRLLPDLRVDVLKVPHHGSRYQDADLLESLGARVAVVSVGAHNDYGHPSASTLSLLRRAGMLIRRTDADGDVAVVVQGGRLEVRARG